MEELSLSNCNKYNSGGGNEPSFYSYRFEKKHDFNFSGLDGRIFFRKSAGRKSDSMNLILSDSDASNTLHKYAIWANKSLEKFSKEILRNNGSYSSSIINSYDNSVCVNFTDPIINIASGEKGYRYNYEKFIHQYWNGMEKTPFLNVDIFICPTLYVFENGDSRGSFRTESIRVNYSYDNFSDRFLLEKKSPITKVVDMKSIKNKHQKKKEYLIKKEISTDVFSEEIII